MIKEAMNKAGMNSKAKAGPSPAAGAKAGGSPTAGASASKEG